MIQTGQQKLGGYTFYWDPDNMLIPEKKKDVAETKTYGGAAIFEWDAILSGTRVVLEWDSMPSGMYKKLRQQYIETGTTYEWNPQTGGNRYNVRIVDLEGQYFGTVHHDGHFRKNVKLALNIRSMASTSQATTTTTTSTTTTTT